GQARVPAMAEQLVRLRRAVRIYALLRLVALTALLIALLTQPATHAASSKACCPRPQDQVWLVSNRGLGCNVEQQATKLKYWRYDCERSWVRSNLAELLAADDRGVTTVFVHGNRIPRDEAFTKGWSAYRML